MPQQPAHARTGYANVELGDYHHYPPSAGYGIMGAGDDYGWLMMSDWKELLVPHVGVQGERFPGRSDTMRVLRCPQIVANEDGKRGQGQYAMNASGTAPFKDPWNLGIGGYSAGVNWKVTPTRESQVRNPADLIAVGDIGPGPAMGETFYTAGHFDLGSTNTWLWPGTSHGGSANLLLCDGHGESGRQTNWIAATDTARRRWNNDGEPHPDTWARP